jgi:hypothetical protein
MMQPRQTVGAVLAAALVILAASMAATADTAGEAIAVVPRTEVATGGEIRTLRLGDSVAVGDIVRTGRGGEAQIIFTDQTRIVVGPNSSLRIDEALFRNNNTARRLTVSALGGTFRFISGESASRAYAVRTPTATMGIRGTAFDFTVTGTDSTDLVVYDGEVRFCGDRRQCAVVPGGCNTVTLARDNAFVLPETVEEKTARLSENFPYLRSQARLLPPFQLGADGCSDENEVILQVRPARNADDGPEDTGGRGGNPAE